MLEGAICCVRGSQVIQWIHMQWPFLFLLTVPKLLWQYKLCYRLKIFEQSQVVTPRGTLLNDYKCVFVVLKYGGV